MEHYIMMQSRKQTSDKPFKSKSPCYAQVWTGPWFRIHNFSLLLVIRVIYYFFYKVSMYIKHRSVGKRNRLSKS
jgi:hypothetical protein